MKIVVARIPAEKFWGIITALLALFSLIKKFAGFSTATCRIYQAAAVAIFFKCPSLLLGGTGQDRMKGRSLQEAIKELDPERGLSAGHRSQHLFLGFGRGSHLDRSLVTREIMAPGAHYCSVNGNSFLFCWLWSLWAHSGITLQEESGSG